MGGSEYFTKLLDVVDQNCGDVVKFCGDAVMIMWALPTSASDLEKAAAVQMSAICALQLLEECGQYRKIISGSDHQRSNGINTGNSSCISSMSNIQSNRSEWPAQAWAAQSLNIVEKSDDPAGPTSPSTLSPATAALAVASSTAVISAEQKSAADTTVVELSLHCGISCGNVHCMILGDAHRMEFLVTGKALGEVGTAEACALAGQACVFPSAYDRIKETLHADPVFNENDTPIERSLHTPASSSPNQRTNNTTNSCHHADSDCVRDCVGDYIVPEHIVQQTVSANDVINENENNNMIKAVQSGELRLVDAHLEGASNPAVVPVEKTDHDTEEEKVPVAYRLSGRLSNKFTTKARPQYQKQKQKDWHLGAASGGVVAESQCNLSDQCSQVGLPAAAGTCVGGASVGALVGEGVYASGGAGAEKMCVSDGTAQYLASLAKELTGLSHRPALTRVKGRITAADVRQSADPAHISSNVDQFPCIDEENSPPNPHHQHHQHTSDVDQFPCIDEENSPPNPLHQHHQHTSDVGVSSGVSGTIPAYLGGVCAREGGG